MGDYFSRIKFYNGVMTGSKVMRIIKGLETFLGFFQKK